MLARRLPRPEQNAAPLSLQRGNREVGRRYPQQRDQKGAGFRDSLDRIWGRYEREGTVKHLSDSLGVNQSNGCVGAAVCSPGLRMNAAIWRLLHLSNKYLPSLPI